MSYSKKKISAEIVADSINTHGNRVTTLLVTFPRFILAELNTHRMFSKNSASSRAIPFEKMVKMVKEDPFVPIAWQKSHSGMQGAEYFIDFQDIEDLEREWLFARDEAVNSAISMNSRNCTKQLLNRLLEPFMWHTVLVTSTEWENFFNLRCPKYLDPSGKSFRSKKDYRNNSKWSCWEGNESDIIGWLECDDSGAEIHMQALAEAIWDARNESTPKLLGENQWHIPFGDNMHDRDITQYIKGKFNSRTEVEEAVENFKIKISSARCARLSYMTFDGEINYEKDIQLHDTLLESGHMSPFEHCCRAMSDLEYYSYIKGKYPTGVEDCGNIYNQERYPFIADNKFEFSDQEWTSLKGENPNNKHLYGWCDNFRGFISYRHLLNEGN